MTLLNDRDLILYRRLLRQARPFGIHIAGFVLLSLLASPLSLLRPLPLLIVVDSGIGSHPLPAALRVFLPVTLSHPSALLLAAALLVAITFASQLQGLAASLLSAYTGEKLLLEFRSELFRHAQKLSLLFHDTKGTAESLYRVQYDATSIQSIVIDNAVPFVSASITVAAMLYVTVRTSWQLAVIGTAIAPILFVVGRHYRRGLRAGSREVRVLEKSALAIVQEVLQGLRLVKAFVREEGERNRFVCRSAEGMRARLRLAIAEGQYSVIVGLIGAIGTAAVLLVGARQVQAGTLTLGSLLLVMGYLTQLFEPLKTMAKKSASLQSHLASAERAFALLDETSEVIEKPNPRPLARPSGAIVFRNVSFAYVPDRPVLHGVSFQVSAGTRVGIAGETGAGKSTLLNLMVRFYDPTEGEILLDGVNLQEYRVADLRNQFAFVPQEPLLFSTSIVENIAYARPQASYDEVIAAAKAAHAEEFIALLPQGYNTLVGERGMCLSGGERQRIAIARAFLKDAPILILDEPTSAVDVGTEALILDAMEHLVHGRTSFLISHRLNALRNCDFILQMEHGRLVSMPQTSLHLRDEDGMVGGEIVSSQRTADV
jgi:ATP-binding cassette subfamily B protein